MSDVQSTNSFAAYHGFHCEGDVCYRTLDFLGFPGYRVGDDGSVWSCWKRGVLATFTDKWRPISPKVVSNNYRGAALYRDKYKLMHLIHRLVLSAFVGPCPPGMECCHNDGIRTNNFVENLRWDTHTNNQQDRVNHGTLPRGETSGTAKLTEANVLSIRQLHKNGTRIKSIAATFGVSTHTIKAIASRRNWKHLP